MSRRPRHSRPLRPAGRPAAAPDEPDLLHEVRDLLTMDHPLPLLTFVSGMIDAVEDKQPGLGGRPPAAADLSLPELVDTFLAVPRIETTALLTVIAELVADEVLARRIRRELAGRDDGLPPWLTDLVPAGPADARLATHALGASTMVLVGVRTAADADLTAVVEVDHTLGSVATDGFCYPGPVDVAAEQLDESDDPDVTITTIDPADARAHMDEAVEIGRITFPPFETDTWPNCRPLVAWLSRHLPRGGQGHVRPEVDDPDREAIIRQFLASPFGRDHDHEDGRGLLESLLWYGCDYGTGDPLTWSAAEVELLLVDWLPRKVIADADHLAGAPDVLRDLIRYGHDERGVRAELTTEALETVDDCEPEYQQVIRTDRPQGPEALLAAAGWLDDPADGPSGLAGSADPMAEYFQLTLDRLRADVGGAAALEGLTTTPLPDEPVDWDEIPAEARESVGAVVDLTDRWCDHELGDAEIRTACRRLVTDVASADPGIFTGRGRTDTAAAALVWLVGKANGLFDSWGGGRSISEMTAWFGVAASPSQRARRMLRALGIDDTTHPYVHLGTPRYLISERRRTYVEQRAVARAYLAGDTTYGAARRWSHPDADVPQWDDDPWDGRDERLRLGEVLPERGVDPVPAVPWRGPDPLDVLAVGWFPPEEFAIAVDRWPAFVERVGTHDYRDYARVVQGTLLDLSRDCGRHPVLVPLDTHTVAEHAGRLGLDPGDWQARATLAAELDQQDAGRAWPPGRNDPCWCASGRKYKRCCGTVPSDPDQRPDPTLPSSGDVHAYEFDVTLLGVTPPIWRRLQVAADATFADLHDALQVACGWEHAHLFAFRTPDGTDIAGVPFDTPFGAPAPDATAVPLHRYFARADRCLYEYDFGDGWVHDVQVVDRIAEPVEHRMRLVDGARAFPPEDCGGLPGYHACLEVVTGGDDPDGRGEWLGDWDPEAFDLAAVARHLDH